MADTLIITYREEKGSRLTNQEADNNFRSLIDGVQMVQDGVLRTALLRDETATLRQGAAQSATQANTARGDAQQFAGVANQASTAASGSAAAALESRNQAQGFSTSASQSATAAGQSATNALESENAAKDWANVVAETSAKIPEITIPGAALIANDDADALIFTKKSLDELIEEKIQARGVGSSDAIGVALIEVGGNGGTFVHINEFNQVIDVSAAQFNSHKIWGAIEDVVIDGQDLVRILKFYIKTVWTYIAGYEGLKRIWLMSLERGAGFRVHPAFMEKGKEIDQIYVGKYQASLEDGKLASVPGVLPAVSRSLTNFTNDALARNVGGVDGFMLWSAYQWSAIQFLFMVEYKTMDSQAAVGQGRVSTSSAAEVDAPDVAEATYRGIVGLWGNVWQWCQGISAADDKIRVWDTQGYQTYVDTPHKRAADVAEIIYPITFFDDAGENYDLSDVFIGKTGNTSNTGATAPDYNRLRLGAGPFFSIVGGRWSNGSGAGLWCLYVSYNAGDAGAGLGARLAKV